MVLDFFNHTANYLLLDRTYEVELHAHGYMYADCSQGCHRDLYFMGFSYVTLLKFAGRLAVGRGVQSSLYPRFCQAKFARCWQNHGPIMDYMQWNAVNSGPEYQDQGWDPGPMQDPVFKR